MTTAPTLPAAAVEAGSHLPCPFCGSMDIRILGPRRFKGGPDNQTGRAFPIARCHNCRFKVPGENWDNLGMSAVNAWNRRALPHLASPAEDVAELVERLGRFARDLHSVEWFDTAAAVNEAITALTRIAVERDEARREAKRWERLFDECATARDKAGYFGTVPDCIEYYESAATQYERERDALAERLREVEGVIHRLVFPSNPPMSSQPKTILTQASADPETEGQSNGE